MMTNVKHSLRRLYIVIHRQTVLLYHNSSVWLDMQYASSWDQNPSNFMLDMVSSCLAILVTYSTYVLAFICLNFVLLDTRVLNSLEEICITQVAAVNFFCHSAQPLEEEHLYIYIYIYIYIWWSLETFGNKIV